MRGESAACYPVVYVTDANYAFPLIRAISNRVLDHGTGLEDFVLVGLSYAKGESGADCRNRDYTPTHARAGKAAATDPSVRRYGQSAACLDFVRTQVIPAVERRYRVDPSRRIYVGHSYGALLGLDLRSTVLPDEDHATVFPRGVTRALQAALPASRAELPDATSAMLADEPRSTAMTTSHKKPPPHKDAPPPAGPPEGVPLTPVTRKIGETPGNLQARAEAFKRRRGKTP